MLTFPKLNIRKILNKKNHQGLFIWAKSETWDIFVSGQATLMTAPILLALRPAPRLTVPGAFGYLLGHPL